MEPLTRPQQIAWLVGRRFPWTRFPARSIASSHRSTITDAARAGARELKAELEGLSASDLAARYAAEQQEYADLQIAAAVAAEAAMFYNLPDAMADIRHWSRAAYWTLEEATALALGRDPARVNSKALAAYKDRSGLPSRYFRQLDLAKRALWAGQLYDPVLPTVYLAWAKRMQLEMAADLVGSVEELGLPIADWKSLYETASAALTAQEAATRRALETVTLLQGELAATRTEVAQSLGTRERESLLKLVIGMAKKGYSYDPAALRSDRVPEIVGDLERCGIALSADTVRKYLRQGAELLPAAEEP